MDEQRFDEIERHREANTEWFAGQTDEPPNSGIYAASMIDALVDLYSGKRNWWREQKDEAA